MRRLGCQRRVVLAGSATGSAVWAEVRVPAKLRDEPIEPYFRFALERSWVITAITHMGLQLAGIVWFLLPARIARHGLGNVTICSKCRNLSAEESGSWPGLRARVAPGPDVVIEQMRTNRYFAGALGPRRVLLPLSKRNEQPPQV